jgi:hypothetical protein
MAEAAAVGKRQPRQEDVAKIHTRPPQGLSYTESAGPNEKNPRDHTRFRWIARVFGEEAPVGVEPTMADLQSAALATWLRSHTMGRTSCPRSPRYGSSCRSVKATRSVELCRFLLAEGFRGSGIGIGRTGRLPSVCRAGRPRCRREPSFFDDRSSAASLSSGTARERSAVRPRQGGRLACLRRDRYSLPPRRSRRQRRRPLHARQQGDYPDEQSGLV